MLEGDLPLFSMNTACMLCCRHPRMQPMVCRLSSRSLVTLPWPALAGPLHRRCGSFQTSVEPLTRRSRAAWQPSSQGASRRAALQRVNSQSGPLDNLNRELLIGDALVLLSFATWKQISAIILLPTFPGWLAPLHFNPTRFEEFLSFAATLCGTWVAGGLLSGGYQYSATSELSTALARTCRIWLAAMPVSAAQLVLLVAAEGQALVGTEGFAAVLPLAASGPGEPFVTAAGVLGLMSVWRAFYTTYLDFWNMSEPTERLRDMSYFLESLRSVLLLAVACCVLLQVLGICVGEEQLEELFSGAAQALTVRAAPGGLL